MSEATREYVIEKSRQVIQAYTDRIKSSENYIDYFPIEGKTLINNYSNNIEKQKELLEEFLINDDFFENISDDQLILLMNKCRKLNKLYELNVKDVSEISKIETKGSYFKNGILYINACGTNITLSEIFPQFFYLDFYKNVSFYKKIANLLGIENLNIINKNYSYDFTNSSYILLEIFIDYWSSLDEEKIDIIKKIDNIHGTSMMYDNKDIFRKYYLNQIINRNNLFLGNYKYLTEEKYSSICNKEHYIPKLGYFIDFSLIKELQDKSILEPVFQTVFDDNFKQPTKSFFLQVKGINKIENALTGVSLGLNGKIVKITEPKYFNKNPMNNNFYENSFFTTEDGNRKNGLDYFKDRQAEIRSRPLKGNAPIHNKQQGNNVILLGNQIDKVSGIGGASILLFQGVNGVLSTKKLNTLYISIWETQLDEADIKFFTIQTPRCNNLELIYNYSFVSQNDSDFHNIMRRLHDEIK